MIALLQEWHAAHIRTARLRLRPVRKADAEMLQRVLADEDLYGFIGGEPPSLDVMRRKLAQWELGHSPDWSELWLNWTIELAVRSELAGYVQATVADRRPETMTLAYVLGTAWQGRGFASEAVRSVLEWVAERTGITAVEAHIAPGHLASARVARAAGLQRTSAVDSEGESIWSKRIGEGVRVTRPRSTRRQRTPDRRA